jgi:hypothetical protein
MYSYDIGKEFWRSYRQLDRTQRKLAQTGWAIFLNDPFDSRLGAQKVFTLSLLTRETVYSAALSKDWRVLFMIRQRMVHVWTLNRTAVPPRLARTHSRSMANLM